MDNMYDLYLYVTSDPNTLYKLSHLTNTEVHTYSEYWFEMNEMHDYIVVLEGSTLWYDHPTIIEKTPEWISLEYDKLYNA